MGGAPTIYSFDVINCKTVFKACSNCARLTLGDVQNHVSIGFGNRQGTASEPPANRQRTAREPAGDRQRTAREPPANRQGTASEPSANRQRTAREQAGNALVLLKPYPSILCLIQNRARQGFATVPNRVVPASYLYKNVFQNMANRKGLFRWYEPLPIHACVMTYRAC